MRIPKGNLHMQLLKNIFSNIPLLTSFIVRGIIVGFIIGLTIELVIPDITLFTPWKLLDSPVKFTQIVDINSHRMVWAQTADGKLYLWDSWCDNTPASGKCRQWTETKNIPDNAHKGDIRSMSKSNDCTMGVSSPRKVVECASILTQNGPRASFITYALLDNGTIWYWLPSAGTDVPILTVLIGPSVGAGLGLIIGVFSLIFRKKESNSLPIQA